MPGSASSAALRTATAEAPFGLEARRASEPHQREEVALARRRRAGERGLPRRVRPRKRGQTPLGRGAA
eukprot:9758820-Lingulodinium_polyedra.AAC.1